MCNNDLVIGKSKNCFIVIWLDDGFIACPFCRILFISFLLFASSSFSLPIRSLKEYCATEWFCSAYRKVQHEIPWKSFLGFLCIIKYSVTALTFYSFSFLFQPSPKRSRKNLIFLVTNAWTVPLTLPLRFSEFCETMLMHKYFENFFVWCVRKK